ncbi:MAG: sulfotransferase [Methylovulum sp.]|uniref:sulfotransferase n=1 Tax=Methylovulum sp. TaxID=1916980 RepID=UPI002610A013|nr:sulfotransferase [Methylovulum sp.]MDD2724967.1 sulfotransferase [Methylovulum sp.]MDD5123509.1 sulfotransferase [Methylovulum sp.]
MNQLPSFLCIGMQKAGTSWLYEMLLQHPDIWLPPIKELHYFDHLYCPDNRSWTQWHIQHAAKNLIKDQLEQAKAVDFSFIRYLATMAMRPLFTEIWYRRAFNRQAANGKILGDITPEYCAIGDEGVAYVKHLLGEVKIIWIVRDPVERALSQLRMNIERRGLDSGMTLSEWLKLANATEVLNRGNYADYIPRWERQFGREGILFMPFQHIGRQPYKVLQQIESFIGVGQWDAYTGLDKKIHATQAYTVPKEVSVYFSELFQPQYRFLESYFTADFVSAI